MVRTPLCYECDAGPTQEVQQRESLQSLAQEWSEVYEDLSGMPGHLSLDRQDRYT